MSRPPTSTARIIGTALLAGLLQSCQSPGVEDYQAITPGMTAAAVEAHLGAPSSRLHAPEAMPDHPPLPWAQRWHWGDTLSTAATNALFADQPPAPQIGTVWFDANGTVLRVQAPRLEVERAADPWALPPR